MAHSTLRNLENSAFVATPLVRGFQIAHLVRFEGETNVFDPTCGEGDLLLPFATLPDVHLYGVEISRERALEARRRLPHASILINAVEGTNITDRSMGLVVGNPPYFNLDGSRAEYQVTAQAGATLCRGGVLVDVLPARSAWNRTMVNHWCRFYDHIRCWKFPDGDPDDPAAFPQYTQIVVAGERRKTPLETPDPLEQERLLGWRWIEIKAGVYGWAGGTPPPDLPDGPIDDPYLVPTVRTIPQLIARHASEELLLEALEQSGIHTSPDWVRATTWEPDAFADPPLMPLLGETHQAAEILTGLLDGVPLTGPEEERCIFSSFVSQKWTEVEVEPEQLEEEREKGVTNFRVFRQADSPVLGALNLGTGESHYYQGEEVYSFLAPWLRGLADLVFEKRRPRYELNPQEWELAVCAPIGIDKELPGAPHPGLVAAQLHRVFALGRGLDLCHRAAEQADPGTGKTRQATALAARQAALWRAAQARQSPAVSEACPGLSTYRTPDWTRRLRHAWQRNPRSSALLRPGQEGPTALPVLVMTPRRVIPTWQYEVTHAWPDAEVMVLDRYTDIDRWMQRCVETSAPAVIGIVSHGLSRAFGRCWKPAVTERIKKRRVKDLEPPKDLLEQLEEAHDQKGRFVGFRWKETGQFFTKIIQESRFSCPDCGRVVMAVPQGGRRRGKEEDALEAVTSLTWFTKQPRTCAYCTSPLWSEVRVIPKAKEQLPLPELIRQGYRNVPFAIWDQGVEQSLRAARAGNASRAAAVWNASPFPWRKGGKRPKPREEGEEQEGDETRWPNPLSGLRMGKACRNPQAPIDRKACRMVTAADKKARMGPESFYPAEYLYQFYRGCVAFTVVDESHNGKGQKTDIAHSFHLAQLASQGIVYASGTQYGGQLTDFYHYWYRLHPEFWKRLGLGWNDAELAMKIYGVVEKQVREHEGEARRGSGQTDVTIQNVPAPGISAKLLPHLMADLVFLGVLDVGAYMPPRVEVPIVVDMKDPVLEEALAPARAAVREAKAALDAANERLQDLLTAKEHEQPVTEAELSEARGAVATAEARFEEAALEEVRVQGWVNARDLPKHYDSIVKTLKDAAEAGNGGAAMAKATIPRWWSVLPCVEPRFTVTHTIRGPWGDVLGKETILRTPRLSADYCYPLEQRIREEVAKEQEAGNTAMVYFEQNGEVEKGQRNLAPRLEQLLADLHPWTLSNRVEAEDREEAIRTAVRDGRRSLIVPYLRVKEGLNLHDCVDTIIWGEMALNFFSLDQASRRHWRMGREKMAKLVYVVYAGSEGHVKLCRLAHQSGAAAAFAGEPARGALVEHVGAQKTMLSRLGSSLERLEEEPAPALASQEELEAAFARRSEELAEALRQGRQWAGYVDTLPERLSAFHAARLQGAPVVEAEPALAKGGQALPDTWQLIESASGDVDREMLVADPDADVLAEVLVHEHPGMLKPARAGRDTQPRQVPVVLWDVVEPVAAETPGSMQAGAQPAARTPQPPPAPSLRPVGKGPLVQTGTAARVSWSDVPSGAERPPSERSRGATITVQWWDLVVQFPKTGAHVSTMRRLSRTYGGGFDWGMEAWVFPLDTSKQPMHVFDAVLEAFPHLEGMAEAEARALTKLLTQLRRLYQQVNEGRMPDEEALRREVQTCSAAQRWIRELHRRLEAQAAPMQARA